MGYIIQRQQKIIWKPGLHYSKTPESRMKWVDKQRIKDNVFHAQVILLIFLAKSVTKYLDMF